MKTLLSVNLFPLSSRYLDLFRKWVLISFSDQRKSREIFGALLSINLLPFSSRYLDFFRTWVCLVSLIKGKVGIFLLLMSWFACVCRLLWHIQLDM